MLFFSSSYFVCPLFILIFTLYPSPSPPFFSLSILFKFFYRIFCFISSFLRWLKNLSFLFLRREWHSILNFLEAQRCHESAINRCHLENLRNSRSLKGGKLFNRRDEDQIRNLKKIKKIFTASFIALNAKPA